MFDDINKIILNNSQKLWLKESVDMFMNFEYPDRFVVKVRLLDIVNKDFNPNTIDKALFESGYYPTIMGIWYIYPEHEIFKVIDDVIIIIRKMIVNNPKIDKIQAEELITASGYEKKEIYQAIYILNNTIKLFHSVNTNNDYFSDVQIYETQLKERFIDYIDLETESSKYYNSISTKSLSANKKIMKSMDDNEIIKDSAFIIMAMNNEIPELDDVHNAIKEVCKMFSINAVRADDIEHQDKITDVIIDRIRKSEFIIADITYEKPNVYYEIGFSHAIGKRPILLRKGSTPLHFDIAGYNVPEYSNITKLRELLTNRLEAITGKQPKR